MTTTMMMTVRADTELQCTGLCPTGINPNRPCARSLSP
jgi:hypothetical protein